jgi:dTDP-4-dehydrorhamnose reductase
MRPAILLIGTNGQVGRELRKTLPSVGDVTGLDRNQLDLEHPEEIRRAIRAFRPDLIVNAAAYTAVDKAETDEAAARAINATAPGIIAEEAKKIGAAIVHYSTDYVFDGAKNTPYTEDDSTNPQNVYGKTKLEGEHAIQGSGAPHLIFRTEWVYATEGRNFLLTILKLATQRKELRIVADQIGSPTSNREIARATASILSKIWTGGAGDAVSLPDASGVYHLTAAGETTWCDFARAIMEEAESIDPGTPWFAAATNHLPLITRSIVPIGTSEYPVPAHRPAYSVLSNARLIRTFSDGLRDWREQLSSVFRDF